MDSSLSNDLSLSSDILKKDTLKAYIQYARENINPYLSNEAAKRAVSAYLELRNLGSTYNRNVITATPRQLESLLRISEAFAKMRLSEEVTVADINEALTLIKESTHSAATDPLTGLVDIDLLITGRSTNERETFEENIEIVKEIIEGLKEKDKESVKLKVLKSMVESKTEGKIKQNELNLILKHLENEDDINIEAHGPNNLVL